MRSMQDNKHQFDITEDADKSVEDDNEDDNLQTVDLKVPEVKPVSMSYLGHTLEFPRKDNVYKSKEALPFDESDSLVWKRAFKNDWRENLKHWFIYIIGGICIGITAFGMDKLEELLVNSNGKLLQFIINLQGQNATWQLIIYPLLAYCGVAAILGLLAGIMTVYYGPGANGSGVAEMIGYMNGVNYPEFIGINTLLTKIFGVTLAVSSRLCVGKEGPLAHIGSNAALLAVYLPVESFKTLQNDYVKR